MCPRGETLQQRGQEMFSKNTQKRNREVTRGKEGSCLKDQVNGSAIPRISNVRKEIIYSIKIED